MFSSISEARCVHKHMNKEKLSVRDRKMDCKPVIEILEYLGKRIALSGKKIKTYLARRFLGQNI